MTVNEYIFDPVFSTLLMASLSLCFGLALVAFFDIAYGWGRAFENLKSLALVLRNSFEAVSAVFQSATRASASFLDMSLKSLDLLLRTFSFVETKILTTRPLRLKSTSAGGQYYGATEQGIRIYLNEA